MRAYDGAYVRVEDVAETALAHEGLAVLAGLLGRVGFGDYEGLARGVHDQLLHILYYLLEALLVAAHLLPDLKVALVVEVHDGDDVERRAEGRRGRGR